MGQKQELRYTIQALVADLRANLQEISHDSFAQTRVVTDTRDRLHYIASLTEQAASQTLNMAESLGTRLEDQARQARVLARRTRSRAIRDFLLTLENEYARSAKELSQIIQAQAFQDLVGQVVNKLLVTVEKIESGLAHLLIEAEADDGLLAGPQVGTSAGLGQDDIDSLFD